ncbi:MAG: AAA family ATPase [Planctomycetota bacterium]
MYETYWGLQVKPFENTPDPAFFYYSTQHEEALLLLNYGITQGKGGIILTGDYGTGKTLLSQVLTKILEPTKYKTVLLTNPRLTSLEFLQEIVRQLSELESLPTTKSEVLNAINVSLRKNFYDKLISVIVIDEAQAIDDVKVLDEIRLLLNFQLEDRFLVNIVFLGQPELKKKINEIPQLKQRLGIRCHLSPLNEDESRAYIMHRLKIAHGDDSEIDIFTEESLKLIWKHSNGLPREINNICDMCLLLGYDRQSVNITPDIINEVCLKFVW